MESELRKNPREYERIFDKKYKIKYVSRLNGKKLYTQKKYMVMEELKNIVLKLKMQLH